VVLKIVEELLAPTGETGDPTALAVKPKPVGIKGGTWLPRGRLARELGPEEARLGEQKGNSGELAALVINEHKCW
jgi:hypothetical protein